MAVIGSERKALRMVKVLKRGTKNQIADKMGVSPDYAEYLCKQMVLGGYLSQAGEASVSRVYRLTPLGEEATSRTWNQPSHLPMA